MEDVGGFQVPVVAGEGLWLLFRYVARMME